MYYDKRIKHEMYDANFTTVNVLKIVNYIAKNISKKFFFYIYTPTLSLIGLKNEIKIWTL